MRIFTYNTNPITNQKWLIIGSLFLALSWSSLHAQITIKVTQDASTDNSYVTGGATPSLTGSGREFCSNAIGMSNYTNNGFSGTTIVNYIGEFNSWYTADGMTALKFTLPPSAGVLASVKLRLKIVEVVGIPIVTIQSTDDNAWVEENTATSYFALLSNPTTLVSSALINESDAGTWKEFDITSYISSKMGASSTTVSMILTGNSNTGGDKYFNFVADDNLADLTESASDRNLAVIYNANADVEQLVLTYATPSITTQAVSGITTTTATGKGNVTSLGTSNPTAYGICWNTSGTPTTSDSKVNKGATSATGAFTASMTSLTANTTYYVRAFATNTAGTSYGAEVLFTTGTIAPTVTTSAASSITSSGALLGGTINANNATTTAGIQYGTTSSYGTTIAATPSSVAGTSNTNVSASLNSLNPGTTYHYRVVGVNAGGTSYGSDLTITTSTTVPGAPTSVSATGGNGSASVSFTAPASNGGSAITSYTVTSRPGSLTGTGSASPITVSGLTNGTAYTFTVTATNANGTGSSSTASTSVTPATVPDAPTSVSAVGGNGSASVSFTAPASNGGSVITSYTVTSAPGNLTGTSSTSPITVSGLTNGTAYTFTVTATNANGTGSSSTASTSVTLAITVIPTTVVASVSKIAVSVYPNPVTDEVHITTDNTDDKGTYNILSVSGLVVAFGQITNGQAIAHLNHLANGTYIIQIQVGTKLTSYRVVKI